MAKFNGFDELFRQNYRKENYSLFHSYRGRGEISPLWSPTFPLFGSPPNILMPGMKQEAWPYVPVRKDDVDVDAITDDWMLEQKVRKPYESVRMLKRYFARNYPEMKYNRCLGWGGNGLAAAYDIMNEEGEKQKSVVVKMLFEEDQELQKWEVQNSQKAEHITQLIYADGMGLVDNEATYNDNTKNPDGSLKETPDSPVSSAEEDPDRDGDRDEDMPNSKRVRSEGSPLNVFITEMLENGDLSSILKKVRQHRDHVPNPILWRFLLCFVRMCIGLAYPPADIEELNDRPGPIKETIPTRLRDNPRRIVHFDMDPKNIFVGDIWPGDEEHSITPILKLGDFGLTTEVVPGKHDFYYERLRQFGKKGYYAPEQFCQDWDYIEPDRDQVQYQTLAGNFGVHTNVWAVGYLMENLITLCYPAGPPVPTVSNIRPPDGKTEYLTYAAHLQQPFYDHVDRDLIALILRLQAHFPEDRPPLHEIETYVSFQIKAKGNDGMNDREVDEWVRKILYEVPPRTNEQYMAGPVIREFKEKQSVPRVSSRNVAVSEQGIERMGGGFISGDNEQAAEQVAEQELRDGDGKRNFYTGWFLRVIRSRAGLRKIYDEHPNYRLRLHVPSNRYPVILMARSSPLDPTNICFVWVQPCTIS
ncbi:kinase-like domain-containing protein [Xylaria castorea]|nr:kinase-like domain-containing protein [Xylaria castorea]